MCLHGHIDLNAWYLGRLLIKKGKCQHQSTILKTSLFNNCIIYKLIGLAWILWRTNICSCVRVEDEPVLLLSPLEPLSTNLPPLLGPFSTSSNPSSHYGNFSSTRFHSSLSFFLFRITTFSSLIIIQSSNLFTIISLADLWIVVVLLTNIEPKRGCLFFLH